MDDFKIPPKYEPKWNTFIIPVIITTYIERCLECIYANTKESSFYVYILDQTVNGLDATKLRNKYRNLMIIRTPKSDRHYTGNLGFAKATNLGISLVTTPYFTMLNDDVEIIYKDWFQGVLDTFAQVEHDTPNTPAVLVNPASTRMADWSLGRASGDHFDVIPHKDKYDDEDWRVLTQEDHYVNEALTLHPNIVIDGVAMYASVCDTTKFLEVGYLDERWYPGSAEDYDWGSIAYMKGYRCVGTTKSWVFHWWSSSMKAAREEDDIKSLMQDELRQGDLGDKWPDNRFDLWGYKCECGKNMRSADGKIAVCPEHPDKTFVIPESEIQPLQTDTTTYITLVLYLEHGI